MSTFENVVGPTRLVQVKVNILNDFPALTVD